MNYESFKRYVADHIRDFLPQDYKVHEISITEQRKNNNVIWDALSIKGDRNIVPAIYLEPYYQAYTEGIKMDTILQKIADLYMESMEQVGEFSADRFQYEKVKNGIFVVVQNAEMNRELLENVPHERSCRKPYQHLRNTRSMKNTEKQLFIAQQLLLFVLLGSGNLSKRLPIRFFMSKEPEISLALFTKQISAIQ